MTDLLSKLFIKNYKDTANPRVRTAYGTMVSVVGILLNLLLFAAKITVGLLFGAISIIGDAVNNLSDAGSQIISLITFRIAAKPADRKHPFGHGRIEYRRCPTLRTSGHGSSYAEGCRRFRRRS